MSVLTAQDKVGDEVTVDSSNEGDNLSQILIAFSPLRCYSFLNGLCVCYTSPNLIAMFSVNISRRVDCWTHDGHSFETPSCGHPLTIILDYFTSQLLGDYHLTTSVLDHHLTNIFQKTPLFCALDHHLTNTHLLLLS